jgi:hypothetical protein
MPTATGTTCQVKAMSGLHMTPPTRGGIPTATATGFSHRDTDMSGLRATRGVICPTSAAHGISTTVLVGVGLQDSVDVSLGGVLVSAVTTRDRGSVGSCREGIVHLTGRSHRHTDPVMVIQFR